MATAEEGVPARAGGLFEGGEGAIDLRDGVSVAGDQHPLLDDRGEVVIFELDLIEAALVELEHLLGVGELRSDVLLADHEAQLLLTGDEADDRDVTAGMVPLHELDHTADPRADEVGVAGVHAEPEDQLVEEQDHGGVTERLGVAGELLQASVEVDVRAPLLARVALEEWRADEGGEEVGPLLRAIRGSGCVEAGPVPGATELAPSALLCGRAEGGEECLVAELLAQGVGVGEQAGIREQERQRSVGVMDAEMSEVGAEDGTLEARLVEHVQAKLQDSPLSGPGVGRA